MDNYKKILVAFDGSESSRNALRQAIALARAEKLWIKALAVVPIYEGDLELIGVSNIRDVLKGPAEKLVAEAAEIASAESTSLLTSVEEGKAYEQIVNVADAHGCDLIVMGRRGLRRFERILIGSITARVIGSFNSDILVVPRDATVKWDRVLLATDGSKYSEIATERAILLAKSYGGELLVVSVAGVDSGFYSLVPKAAEQLVQKAGETVEAARVKAEAAGVSTRTFVRKGGAHLTIVELCREEKADLIVVGCHGVTGLERLLMGSVAERVIGLAPCAVLVVK